MNGKLKNSLEALGLLQDWTKWLIGLSSSAIVAIGALTVMGKTSGAYQVNDGSYLALASVAFLLYSILISGSLLLSLPGIAQHLDSLEDGHDIFYMGTLNGKGTQVFVFAAAQHITCIIGLVFFSAFIAYLIHEWFMVTIFLFVLGSMYLVLSLVFKIEILGHLRVMKGKGDSASK